MENTLIGRTLAHYEVVASLGKGGMGEVYVAEDTKLQRRVALKVLPKEMAADPERPSRFEREARAVAALSHPNIVTVHSVEEADGVHFITMELVEGQTLSKMLPRNGFSLSELLEIAIPLADAVSSAHRTGITHRDLKPDNIMVDGEGRLRVLDFGLAKLHDPVGSEEGMTQAPTAAVETEEGKILGTVAYMSPEQAEGKSVDPRSDVFSLGTILHEMATGERPFRGDTKMSTIGSILRDQPAPVTEHNRSLPRHLGRIIRRCLAKDPERRYQSALDLRNELEELKAEIDSGEFTSESTGTTVRSTWSSWKLALPIIVGLAGIVAFLAVRALSPPDVAVARYSSRPITATNEWVGDLSWSPHSEFIAYSSVIDGSLDVVIQPVAGGDAVVRATGVGDETAPRWSPDGKYLSYLSTSEPGTGVFLIPPHGGSRRRLIDTNLPALDIDNILNAVGARPWSIDSQSLLVSRIADSGHVAVFRIDREDGEAEQLTHPPTGSDDFGASYSFDGERIVFQRRTNGRGTLLTMPAAGGRPDVLVADEFDNLGPAWRPDNRRLVYRSNRGDGGQLWEIDTVSGSMIQLTFETKGVYGHSVSGDDRIAHAPYWHDTFLFLVDLDSGEKRQITDHTADNFGARFSPDGESIAYHSSRTGDTEIWLHHLDGRSETRVTDHPSWDLYPEWSPDGQRLVFVSNREGPFKVFTVNRDGGDVRLLVDQSISLRNPQPVNAGFVCRWSPDGGRIAYLIAGDGSSDLWAVGADGLGARQVLENVVAFDWYREGRIAVFSRHLDSETELKAVDLETGREDRLFVGPLMEFDVSPDGTAVTFCFGRGHLGMGLARLRLDPSSEPGGLPTAVGEPEYIVPTEGTWHVHNGGWSADSKTLVYTRDKDYSNIYELVERR